MKKAEREPPAAELAKMYWKKLTPAEREAEMKRRRELGLKRRQESLK